MGLISDKSYEDVLGDGIERALAGGATTLEVIVAVSNQMQMFADRRGRSGMSI